MKSGAIKSEPGDEVCPIETNPVGTVPIDLLRDGAPSDRALQYPQSLVDKSDSITEKLQARIAELESFNSDLANLFAGCDITMICLDRKCSIKWFVPLANNHCNLTEKDLGRHISGIQQTIAGDALLEEAQAVLERRVPVKHDVVMADGRCFLRRIMPYRATDNHAGGLIISYSDITENRRLADKAADIQRSMAATLEKMVQIRTAQLAILASELANAEERERRKLAQDLHDDLSQVLSIIKLKLTILNHEERRGNLTGTIKELQTLTDQASCSVRSLAMRLSPPVLQTLGLVPALEWLAEEVERLYGLTVSVHDDGESKHLNEPTRTLVYRAASELLVNVAKHAGTQSAELNCCVLGRDRMVVAVSDIGNGFDYEKILTDHSGATGLGLLGIRERIASVGGEVHVDSLPGEGTTVTLTIPLEPVESGEETA